MAVPCGLSCASPRLRSFHPIAAGCLPAETWWGGPLCASCHEASCRRMWTASCSVVATASAPATQRSGGCSWSTPSVIFQTDTPSSRGPLSRLEVPANGSPDAVPNAYHFLSRARARTRGTRRLKGYRSPRDDRRRWGLVGGRSSSSSTKAQSRERVARRESARCQERSGEGGILVVPRIPSTTNPTSSV